MPIVPLVEVFGFVYFVGWYLIWKHQCLHIYVQEFEGGGLLFEKISGFFMVGMYTAQVVVCAYFGLKKAAGPAIFTLVVAFLGTIIAHYRLRRNIAGPLKNLSLEVAASVDLKEGELLIHKEIDEGPSAIAVEHQLYAQPFLKESCDERSPMPYRRLQGSGSQERSNDNYRDDASCSD